LKDIDPALQAHLNTRATTIAYCWKIERQDGVVFGFTEHDQDLVFDGVTYKAESGFTRTRVASSLGLSVDNMDVAGALRSDDLSEDDIANGRFDFAAITVYGVNWQNVSQRWVEGRGQLGEITRGALAFQAEVRSLSDRLQQKTGRIYHYYCDADLGDGRCTIDLTSATYKATGTVGMGSTARTLILSGVSGYDEGWFSGGLVRLTSGDLDGLAREIKAHTISGGVHYAELWQALPAIPAGGVSLIVTAGCDKTATTCAARFANLDNFRGFPLMPGNDRVTAYPRQGEVMDGGSLFR
jgi:uncharacterized phage protein (TIGR02218 family)